MKSTGGDAPKRSAAPRRKVAGPKRSPVDAGPATTSPADAPERERVGRYRIGAVANATGISTHTLRVWERRYDAFALSRTGGGVRLYSDADVARLRVLKQLLDRGHAIGQIARLPDAELARLLMEGGLPLSQPTAAPLAMGAGPASIREAFLEAVRTFDLASAERILLGAVAASEPRPLILELLPPLFEEIGRRWSTGEFHIAHEHAASGLLRNALGAVLKTWRPAPDAGTLVATTLSGELHEFGALLTALLGAAHGWNAVYLGPNLPAEEIAFAARQSRARAVLVSLVHAEGASELRRFRGQLALLQEGLPAGVELVAGGAAASRLLAAPGRATVLPDLTTFDAWLTARRR